MNTALLASLVSGASLVVSSNHGLRPANVLAVRSQQALIEYHMPGGSTALRLLDLSPLNNECWWWRAIPYRALSPAWLQAIVDAGQHWTARPQQHGQTSMQVPPVEILLEQKCFDLAFRSFWRSATALRFLDALRGQRGCGTVTGWDRGGCGIAALGILQCIRASPDDTCQGKRTSRARLLAMAGRGHPAAHVFVSLRVGKIELCLDPSGFRTRTSLQRRWAGHYRLPNAHVVRMGEDEQTFRRVRVPYSRAIGADVAGALFHALGPFPLPRLFPPPLLVVVHTPHA